MDREELEERFGKGKVWDTKELQEKFKVISFAAPWAMVEDKETGNRGSVTFQHAPRFYYDFQPSD